MLLKRVALLAGGLALAIAWGTQGAHAQGVFTISSKSFKDGERLASAQCPGRQEPRRAAAAVPKRSRRGLGPGAYPCRGVVSG